MKNVPKENAKLCTCCNLFYNIETKFCANCKKELVDYVYNDYGKKVVFLKLSNKAILESIKKGNVWLQSPKYYQDFIESQENTVSDKQELLFAFREKLSKEQSIAKIDISKIYISFKGKRFALKDLNFTSRINLFNLDINEYRLLCFYALEIDNDHNYVNVDPRLKGFGDSFCVMESNDFLSIITNYENKKGYTAEADFCTYITDTYDGVIGPFTKDYEYVWQNEFRIVLKSKEFLKLKEKEPLIIENCEGLKQSLSKIYSIEQLFNCKNIDEWR